MTIVELAFGVTALALLSCLLIAPMQRRAAWALWLAVVALGSTASLQSWPRWQLFPALVVVLAALPFVWRRRQSRLPARIAGGLLGLFGVTLSMLLATALPMFALPVPDGPYAVGVRSFTISQDVYVQAWYPAPQGARGEVRTFWQELYGGPRNRLSFFTRYLSHIPTHSIADATVESSQERFPVVLFNHALASIPEQNTPLMEHLASNGYIVLAAGRERQSMVVNRSDGTAVPVDFPRIRAALDELRKVDENAIDRRAAALPDAERAREHLTMAAYTPLMNALMNEWVQGLRIMLDVVATGQGASPPLRELLDRAAVNRIGLVGMSFGGQAVNETCKVDERCHAGVNIDGALFGAHQSEPLRQPFLTVVSPANEKYHHLDLLLAPAKACNVVVAGTEHGDFLDISFAMPFLKWLGVTGSIDAWRATRILNEVTLAFLDSHIGSEQDSPVPWPDDIELRVESRGELEVARRTACRGAAPTLQ